MLVRQFVLQLNAGANVNPVIHTNQYDDGELWCFTLLSGTQVVQPEESAMIGLASGGKTYDVNGYVDELWRACITETTEITSSPGQGEYELQVGGHGTANFYVQVEARPTDGAVISDDEMSFFDNAVRETAENANTAKDAAQSVSGYIDFSQRTQKDTPDLTDIFAMQSASGDPLKIDYNNLAKAIIEQYRGSSLGVSIKQAIDNLGSMVYKNTLNLDTFEFDVNRVLEGTEVNPDYRFYSMLMYGCVSAANSTAGSFMYLVFAGTARTADLAFIPIIAGNRTYTGTISENHVTIKASSVVYGGIYVICL